MQPNRGGEMGPEEIKLKNEAVQALNEHFVNFTFVEALAHRNNKGVLDLIKIVLGNKMDLLYSSRDRNRIVITKRPGGNSNVPNDLELVLDHGNLVLANGTANNHPINVHLDPSEWIRWPEVLKTAEIILINRTRAESQKAEQEALKNETQLAAEKAMAAKGPVQKAVKTTKKGDPLRVELVVQKSTPTVQDSMEDQFLKDLQMGTLNQAMELLKIEQAEIDPKKPEEIKKGLEGVYKNLLGKSSKFNLAIDQSKDSKGNFESQFTIKAGELAVKEPNHEVKAKVESPKVEKKVGKKAQKDAKPKASPAKPKADDKKRDPTLLPRKQK